MAITAHYGFGIWQLNETPFAELTDILPDGTENTSGLCLNDNWRGIDTQLWNIHEGLGMNLQFVKPFTEDYGLWTFDDTGEAKKALMLEGIDEVRLVTSSDILATQSYVQQFAQGVDWQKSVLDKDLTAPPGSPSTGDRYIVATGGTGAWAGHDDDIAEWNGTAWEFTTPNESYACGVEDEDTFYIYNSTAWVKMAGIFNHNDLSNIFGDSAGYHLNQTDYDNLVDTNAQLADLHTDGSPLFANLDLTGELRLDDNKPLYLDTANTKSLKWGSVNSRFEFNSSLRVAENLQLLNNYSLFLDTAVTKGLKWNSASVRFEFNDNLYAPFYYGDGSNLINVGIGTPVRVSLTVKNASGATIGKGLPVYVSGASGQLPTIEIAGNTDWDKTHVIGMTAESIPNLATGLVAMRGELTEVNTSGGAENWSDGDSLYLAANNYAGSSLTAITNVIPTTGQIVHFAHVSFANAATGKVIIQTHRTQEICAPSGINLLLRMGDNAGVNKVLFKDYNNVERGSVDSDGLATFENFYGAGATFTEDLFLGHSSTTAGIITFFDGTGYNKTLKYNDTLSRFEFNTALNINDELTCNSLGLNSGDITDVASLEVNAQLSIYGSQKFGDDKKLYFGTDDDIEMFWDSANSWLSVYGTGFWLMDSPSFNYYFGMDSSGISTRFRVGAGVGNWAEWWMSKSGTFLDFYFGGGSSGGAAGFKRLGLYGTKDTAKDYRLKLWDEDNTTYFQLGRVSGIWESNKDINLIGSVLKVGDTQVVGAQGATISDPSGGTTIDAEARTAINAIIDRLQAHGLIA